MQCKEVKKRLSEYVDNALDPQETGEVEHHLQGCGACSRRLAELEGVVGLLHSLPREDVPHDLAVRIMEKSSENGLNRPSGAGLWHRIAGVAAMVAVVIGVLILAKPQQNMYEDLLQGSARKDEGASAKPVVDSLRKQKEETEAYGRVLANRIPTTGSPSVTASPDEETQAFGRAVREMAREKSVALESMELYVASERPWDYIKMLVAGAGQLGASEIVVSEIDDEDSSAGLALVVKLTKDGAGKFARLVHKLSEEQKEESMEDLACEGQDQDIFRHKEESWPVTVRIKILSGDER